MDYGFPIDPRCRPNYINQSSKSLIILCLAFSSVHPSGEVSNFLLEDLDAISKFMSTDVQKRKFKL